MKVDIPATDQSISTGDPTGSLVNMGEATVAFAALAVVAGLGLMLGGSVQDSIAQAVGMEEDSGGFQLEGDL